MMSGNRQQIVSVCREGGISALEEPRFLLEVDGKLYLTMAVLEYDPEHEGITHEQRHAIAELQDFMGEAEGVRAVSFSSYKTDIGRLMFANTSVPPLPPPIE